MVTAILGNAGYFAGIGVEVFVILICGALLALMLTGVLFKWLEQYKVTSLAKSEAKAAAAEARAVVEEEAAAQAAAEAEAERAQTEIDALAKKEAEAAAAEAAEVAAKKKAEEEEKNKPRLQPAPAKAEEEQVTERVVERVVVQEPAAVAEAAVTEEEEVTEEVEETDDGERDFVVVHDGIVFNDSKTITELYEELSPEQQSYFDELREEALSKPDAELAIAKNFISVKIGKRNLIKLLIKRGVTVAEFMLENDALKALRLSNTNKRGKSAIKIKPTVVQVLDLNSLKVAVDMINLSYEELMLGD